MISEAEPSRNDNKAVIDQNAPLARGYPRQPSLSRRIDVVIIGCVQGQA